MNVQLIPDLRIAVGALAIGALLTQVFITPLFANSFAEAYPEAAYLALPYMIAIIAAICGIEAALLAIWKLLSIVKRGEVSTGPSLGWVNFITGCLLFTAAIMASVFAHASFVAYVGGPPVFFGLLASIALGAGAIFLRTSMKRGLIADGVEGPLVGGVESRLEFKATT